MNSSIETAEAVKLADKLNARTREGRLQWEVVGLPEPWGATSFTTTLEGNLKATVSTVKPEQDIQIAFSLVEADPQWSPISGGEPEKDVLRVSVERDPSFGYDTKDEKQLARLLVDLYELARRSALKIDGSVEKALSYLDRIAV